MLFANLDSDTTITITIGGIISLAIVVWRIVVLVVRTRDDYRDLQREHTELKRKVGVMWGFQTKRGQTEAENAGVVTADPPSGQWNYLPAYVRGRFANLKVELRTFFRLEGFRLSDEDLKLEIEGRFGPRIVADVCKPLKWHEGACLHTAAIIAREDDD